jgi:hypothetical protein
LRFVLSRANCEQYAGSLVCVLATGRILLDDFTARPVALLPARHALEPCLREDAGRVVEDHPDDRRHLHLTCTGRNHRRKVVVGAD